MTGTSDEGNASASRSSGDNWQTLANQLDTLGDDAVDRLVNAVLNHCPGPDATPSLIRALNLSISESSKRSCAVALAIIAQPEDPDAVEALESAYQSVRSHASLGPALLKSLGVLGMRCATARASSLAAIQRLRLSDLPWLLIAGAKVIGMLASQRPDDDLRKKLVFFVGSDDAGVEAEARYQLALLMLTDAFAAEKRGTLITELENALAEFAAASEAEEMRPDTDLLKLLIELVIKFDAVASGRKSELADVRRLATAVRRSVGGFGKQVFRGYRSDAAVSLAKRALDAANALERAAVDVVEAHVWTDLDGAVTLLTESYCEIQSCPDVFRAQKSLDAAISAIARDVLAPRFGPVLMRHVGRERLARVIQNYEKHHGMDCIAAGLRVLEASAHEAERAGDLQLSPRKHAELVALAQKARRTPDELVSDISLAIERNETEQWAVRIGIAGELPHAEWREPVHNALLSAFDYRTLERMLRLKMSIRLDRIARQQGNLEDNVFDLLQWAEQRNQVASLLQAALADNPGNIELQQIRENFPGFFQ